MPLSPRSFLGAEPAAPPAQVHADTPTRGDLTNPTGPTRLPTVHGFTREEIKIIEGAAPDVKLLVSKSSAEFRTNLREADAVYGSLSKEGLDYAPKVKWLQAAAAGMEG